MPVHNSEDNLTLTKLIDIGRNWYSFRDYTSLSETELRTVLDWRNHEAIRRWMHNQAEISWDDHLSFVDSLRQNLTKVYWLVERDGEPVGSLNLTILSEMEGEWGYYLGTEYIGKGFGVEFCYYIIDHLMTKCNIDVLVGFAKPENNAANSLNTLFEFSSEAVELQVNGVCGRYLKRTLTRDQWLNTVSRGSRLLELTCMSIRRKMAAKG
jgi:UDP-4-amino-4,6-dideoxy-N-acetyl-beta-L-altrosamine N-acetyltransferase